MPCHFGERWVQTWHARGVVPEEERRVRRHRAVDEVERAPNELCVDVLHVGLGRRVHVRVRRQRTAIDDRLLADPAPARMLGRVVDVGRLGVQDIARAEALMEPGDLWVFGVVRLLHGVEVVEDAVELVEAVDRRQVFVAVAEMVLADLRRRVAKRLEEFGDRRVRILQALLGGGHADLQQAGAERRLAGDERGPPRRAGLLGVVVGEQRTFSGDPVDVGRGPAHHAAVVGAEVPGAHIVGHDHDDVRLLLICHWCPLFLLPDVPGERSTVRC